ncbi:high mobility group B protein 3 [Pyrus x bretschneideri]|uniref:high mobility group B protein 3 n=1 Tax=Pyrus x bretschneideri TaxID=225117 RepID=UPI00202EEA74|nr:high mobility group B protein 3 [Pyrus x bretschneideri]
MLADRAGVKTNDSGRGRRRRSERWPSRKVLAGDWTSGKLFNFQEDFREKYKKEHPNNKSVAAVGKAGGDKWKSLSDAEKAPYQAKADKRKVEYNKNIQAYNKQLAEGNNEADEEESDKSKSEVNDDDEDEDESGEEEDDDE